MFGEMVGKGINSFPRAFSLSVAGFDPTGGAGVITDFRVMKKIGVWCFSVMSCITLQNTSGVFKVVELGEDFIYNEIENVMSDCEKIEYAKVGALGGKNGVLAVKKAIDTYKLKIVLDPVIRSKNGYLLISEEGEKLLNDLLIPSAFVITPNIQEAERLLGIKIRTKEDVFLAGEKFGSRTDAFVIIKGGHLNYTGNGRDSITKGKTNKGKDEGSTKEDFVFHRGKFLFSVKGKSYDVQVHGTGCIFSSAVTAYLSLGLPPEKAFVKASHFTKMAIKRFSKIGKGYPVSVI